MAIDVNRNITTNLNKILESINQENVDSNLYTRVYSFTTENINGYIKFFNLKNKSLLTVGSSGDQILNCYLEGARDITLIDINPYCQYYIYLKIAGIVSLSYQEFIKFFFPQYNNVVNSDRFSSMLFNKIKYNLKTINYDSYLFFETLFTKYNKDKIIKYLFNDDEDNFQVIKNINNYLQTEENFLKLKKIIGSINFNFMNQDLFKYQSAMKYDNIFLSNICTIVSLYELRDLLVKLKNNNLNINGRILIAYLWNMQFNSNYIDFEWKHAYMMPATRLLLKDFITEHYNIKGISDIKFNQDKQRDLVMIYKYKN